MNVKNLIKQCEVVMKLSNGATNNELSFVYETAKDMVANNMGNESHLIFRKCAKDVNRQEVCTMLGNLRMWNFYVIGNTEEMYEWAQVARIREITKIDKEYAMIFRI